MKKKKVPDKKIVEVSHGFTLIELLAVIAILSMILSIGIYFTVSIVNNANNKSYKTTINNIEKASGNYVLEDVSSMVWVPGVDGSYEYQCVTVQNLIDAGYFKGDVVESYVDDDTPVRADDYIYIERDFNSKSITKQILLVGDRESYKGLCTEIKTQGDIRFEIVPSGWATQKDVTIYYSIYNNFDMVSNYKYSYDYESDSGNTDKYLNKKFSNTYSQTSLVVTENGYIYAAITDSNDDVVVSKTLDIKGIDLDAPVAEIKSKNNVASVQNVTLNMSDIGGSGVDKYYFGQVNPKNNDVEWTDVKNAESVSNSTTVDKSGKWYLAVVDVVGNMSVVNATFYETTLSISKGSVTPNTIMTMSGDTFTIPVATANTNYSFVGWYTTSSFSGNSITKYTPTSNSTLYGKTELNDVVGPTIVFSNDGSNDKWIKTATSKITVTDDLSGVDDSTLKYVFSTSKTIDLSDVEPLESGDTTTSTATSTATSSATNSIESTDSSVFEFVSGNSYSLAGANGLYYLHAYACDNAGNCTTKVSKVFKLDNIPPTLTCRDGNKVEILHYKLDSNYDLVFDSNGDKIVAHKQTVEVSLDGNKCYGYHSLLFQKTQISHSLSCSDAYSATDNIGVTNKFCSLKYYDDDGNTYCGWTKSNGEVENCIRMATACNCIHDDIGKYCTVENVYTVSDEAGNTTTDTFVVYVRYNDPTKDNQDYRDTYCTSDRKSNKSSVVEAP